MRTSCFVLIILTLGNICLAQSDKITWSSFNMGAGIAFTSENVTVNSAAGQLFIGESRLGDMHIESGFFADALLRGSPLLVSNGKNIPTTFALHQNYPNPFNPSTIIKFDLPHSAKVSIKLYNMLGQEVMTLLNEQREPGEHRIGLHATNLASGVYFYRLIAGFADADGALSAVKKLVVLK